jgi:hypothetical protein
LSVLRCLVLLLVGLVSPVCRADEPYPFSIESVREAEGHRLVANNHGPAPVSVKLVLIDAANVRADRRFPLFVVVQTTEQGADAVAQGMKQSQAAGESIRQLDDSITASAQAASQIAVSAQQQLAGMDQLVSAMNNIRDAAARNADSTRQTESVAMSLHELGMKLKELMARYRV